MHNKPPLFLLVSLISLIALVPGCGRKLPPLPPGKQEPLSIHSIRFTEGKVSARVVCNEDGARITLLGKAQGICPYCTDDLTVKQELAEAPAGLYQLTDEKPEDACMVYRVRMEKGATVWLSPARIVCDK